MLSYVLWTVAVEERRTSKPASSPANHIRLRAGLCSSAFCYPGSVSTVQGGGFVCRVPLER